MWKGTYGITGSWHADCFQTHRALSLATNQLVPGSSRRTMSRTENLAAAKDADEQSATPAGSTMQAAVIRGFGGIDVLTMEDVAIPEVRPGHLLIKVLAAGVNRLDHQTPGDVELA